MELCGVCTSSPPKYKCPKCLTRTCSLKCCTTHKSSTGCDGKREKTSFVKLNEFSDTHLLSDYRFLEDVDRTSDSMKKSKLNKNNVSKNNFLRKLVNQANKRNMTLKVSPFFTTKRKQNSTIYLKKTNKILWHIGWSVPKYKANFSTPRVDEDRRLGDILAEEVSRQLVKVNCSSGESRDLLPFLRACPSKGVPQYWKLDLNQPLSGNLEKTTLAEYPEIVLASKEDSGNFVLVDKS